jgi:peptidyl-prolyl cis-trans isomerase D
MTMLDRMRRHKGWLKWSLVLIVLAFIAFYIPSFLDNPAALGVSSNETVAEVDGVELTAGEFRLRYNQQVAAYRQAYGASMSDQLLRQLGIEQQILQGMIDEQAALAEAEAQGIRVSDEELARQIFAIPGLQENGQFVGEARYEQILRSQNPPLTKGGFEENLRRSMMIDKLRAALTDWMSVADAELDQEFRQRNEKVKLQVVALTADAFRDKVTATDAEISAHYEARKAEYRVGEQRRIKYLLIDRDQLHAKTVIPANEVQAEYNRQIAQFQTPEQIRARHILLNTAGKDEAAVRKQADDLLAQIKAGADFAQLATKFSEDEASKVNGGDLDFFARGRMVAEFETAAFALQPGQVSEVVRTQYGFHIIKLEERRPAVTQPLDAVRAQLEDGLKWARADAQVAARTTELAARIDSADDIDTIARETGFAVAESEPFAQGDPVPGLGVAPQVSAEAFTTERGGVSSGVPSPRGTVFFTVTDVRDPYVPALEEVRARVQQDVIRTKAGEVARQRAAEIAAGLKGAANFTAAAKAQGFEAVDTELVARESAIPNVGVSPEVDRVAFSLPVGGVSDPITATDATVIVRVSEKDEVTADELRQGRETFREQLLSERRGRFFTSYMQKVKDAMSIEIRDDVIQRIVAPGGVAATTGTF